MSIRGGDIVFTALVDFTRAVQQINRLERLVNRTAQNISGNIITSTRRATNLLDNAIRASRAVQQQEEALWTRPSIWTAEAEDIHRYFVAANHVLRQLSMLQMGFFALQMTGLSVISMFDQLFSNFVVGAVKARDSLRLMETSFKLLGAGAGTFTKVKTLARDTRYELEEVASIARVLLSLGLPTEKVTEALKPILSYATALNMSSEGIMRIGYALSQIYNSAKVNAQDVRQLTNAFVPVHDIVAKEMGLAAEEVDEAIRKMDPKQLFDIIVRGLAQRSKDVLEQTKNDFVTVIGAIRDNWQQFLAQIGSSSTFTLVTRGLRYVANVLDNLTKSLEKGAGAANWFTRSFANVLGALTILGSAFGRVLIGLGILGGAAYGVSMGWRYLDATLRAVAVAIRTLLVWLGRTATIQGLISAFTRLYTAIRALPAAIRAAVVAMRSMETVAATLRGAIVGALIGLAIWKISEAFSYVTKSKKDIDDMKESVKSLGDELEDLKRGKAGPEEIEEYMRRVQKQLEKLQGMRIDKQKEIEKAMKGDLKVAAVLLGISGVTAALSRLPVVGGIAAAISAVTAAAAAIYEIKAAIQGYRAGKQADKAEKERQAEIKKLEKQLKEAEEVYAAARARVREISQQTTEVVAFYERIALREELAGDVVAQAKASAMAELKRTLDELNEAQARGEDVTQRWALAWDKFDAAVAKASKEVRRMSLESYANTMYLADQAQALRLRAQGKPFEARIMEIKSTHRKAIADIKREFELLTPAEQRMRAPEFIARILYQNEQARDAMTQVGRDFRSMMEEEFVASIRDTANKLQIAGKTVDAEKVRALADYTENLNRLNAMAEEGYNVTKRIGEATSTFYSELKRIDDEAVIQKLAAQIELLRYKAQPFEQVKNLLGQVLPDALKRLFGIEGEKAWRKYELTSKYAELAQTAELWGGGILPEGFRELLTVLQLMEERELEQRRYTVTTTDIVSVWSRAVMRSLEMATPERQMLDISEQQLGELRTTSGLLSQILRKIDEYLAATKSRETHLNRTMESIELNQKGLVANAW